MFGRVERLAAGSGQDDVLRYFIPARVFPYAGNHAYLQAVYVDAICYSRSFLIMNEAMCRCQRKYHPTLANT